MGLYRQKPLCMGGDWKSPLMPCQFLCQVCICMHAHANRSVIIKRSPTSGELIEQQGRPGTHPPTGLLFQPPPSLLSTQWGVSAHAHTLRPPPAEITDSAQCFRVVLVFRPVSAELSLQQRRFYRIKASERTQRKNNTPPQSRRLRLIS